MCPKKFKSLSDIVYSTNPDFNAEPETDNTPDTTLPPEKQPLIVRMERKGRGGKTVTLVQGFTGSDQDMESLAKTLKTKCGVGGAVKDGEIVLQGDFKARIAETLKAMGYTKTKMG
ncbi:MAG TPA: translation initiation factor [Chitinophagales bacterium]|nr:translation initiation factor [Chitinophagales bacterium]